MCAGARQIDCRYAAVTLPLLTLSTRMRDAIPATARLIAAIETC
jgi:hypothetical protein